MTLFAFIGVAVTSATAIIFPAAGDLGSGRAAGAHRRARSPCSSRWSRSSIATLATNIAANVVSPANDFSNLAPRRISFRTGGLITGGDRHR